MKNFKLYYQNVNGLRSKTNEFANNLLQENYDVIALTETRLYSSIGDGELFDDRYTVYRKDLPFNNDTRGWGVLISVNKCYQSEIVETITGGIFDLLCVKIILNSSIIFVIVIYIPPGSSSLNYNDFYESLENINHLFKSNLIIVGDFNLPEIRSANHNLSNGSLHARRLNNFLTLYNLNSYNNVLNSNNRTLDLVLSDMDLLVNRDSCPLVLEDSHHPALDILLSVYSSNHNRHSVLSNNLLYNFKKADFYNLYLDLSTVDWIHLFSFTDVDNAVDYFYDILFSVIDRHVPKRNLNANRKFPAWFTPDIIRDIKKKNVLARKRHHSVYYNEKFMDMRRNIKSRIRYAYERHIQEIQLSIKTNIRNFWSFVNDKRNNSAREMRLFYNNNMLSGCEVASGFASYFSSVYNNIHRPVANLIQSNNMQESQNNNLHIKSITFEDVMVAIKSLKPMSSCGPDGIPPFFVKGCADLVSGGLKFLFNLSLKTGRFPVKWKLAKVTPIFKSGDAKDVNNYRPISLINVFAKVFERVIYKYVYSHLKNSFSPFQHGFLSGKSTVTNLIEFSYDIARGMESSGRMDVIYIDFQKAFDLVNHDVLLHKFSSYGFSQSLINFFSSYLKGRKSFVTYGGFDSFSYEGLSGVPQGTTLGPLFFAILINDLPDFINHSKCLLFADDVKLYRHVNSVEDCSLLQFDLENVMHWCINNGLQINIGKTKTMTYTRQRAVDPFIYKLNNEPLASVTACKDLGVMFDKEMRFDLHVEKLLNEASRLLGFIMRTCYGFSDINVILYLYKSLVRSKLEYAALIWNPYQSTYSDALERIQNKFLRYLYYKKFSYYPPRGFSSSSLRFTFQLPTLKSRRDLMSMLYLYKLIRGDTQHTFHLEKLNFYIPAVQRGRHMSFFIPRSRTLCLYNSPINRLMRTFNSISGNVDLFHPSKTIFLNSCRVLLQF
jgi:hypothetical protein